MNKKYFQKTIVIFLLLAAYGVSEAQPLNTKSIDELVERSMKAFNVPGIAVGLIKDGKVIHAKGYGVR